MNKERKSRVLNPAKAEMKRVISLLLNFVICFTMLPAYASVKVESTDYEKYLSLCSGLMLTNSIDFSSCKPEDFVKPSEFNGVIKDIFKSNIIMLEETTFVTFDEAAHEILCQLGYYRMICSKSISYAISYTDLSDGIKCELDTPLTIGMLSQLLCNALDVEVMDITTIYNSNSNVKISSTNNTMLEKILSIEKNEGIITANGITSLYDEYQSAQNYIRMENGKCYKLSDRCNFVAEFIGQRVTLYSKEDDEGSITVWACLSDNIKKTTVEIERFKNISTGIISFDNYEKDKTETYRLATVPVVIFNGMSEKSVLNDYFDFDFGTVTLVSNNNTSTYDTIIIEGYDSCIVDNVDYENETIYFKAKNKHGEDALCLLNKTVKIYNSENKPMPLNDVVMYDVADICANGDCVKIIISREKLLDCNFTELYQKNHKSYATSEKLGTLEYSVDAIKQNNGILIDDLSCVYKCYINSFNVVVFISFGDEPTDYVGYLIEVGKHDDPFENVYQLKILTSDGDIVIYSLDDKIDYYSENDLYQMLGAESVYKNLRNITGIFQYRINKNGKISKIGFPITSGLNVSSDRLGYYVKNEKMSYSGSYSVGGKFYINIANNPTTFQITPTALGEKNKYKVVPLKNLRNETGALFTAASFGDESLFAQYVSVQYAANTLSGNADWFVVTDVTTALNPEMNVETKLTGAIISDNKPFEKKELFISDELLEELTDSSGTGNKYMIEAGDVLVVDYEGNMVLKAYVLYDITSQLYKKNGALAGNLGYNSGDNPEISNPYKLFSSNYRAVLGFVYSIDPYGAIKYSTQDLSDDNTVYVKEKSDTKYIDDITLLKQQMVKMTIKDGRCTVSRASINDIYAYKTKETRCSQILMNCYSSNSYAVKMIIINNLDK